MCRLLLSKTLRTYGKEQLVSISDETYGSIIIKHSRRQPWQGSAVSPDAQTRKEENSQQFGDKSISHPDEGELQRRLNKIGKNFLLLLRLPSRCSSLPLSDELPASSSVVYYCFPSLSSRAPPLSGFFLFLPQFPDPLLSPSCSRLSPLLPSSQMEPLSSPFFLTFSCRPLRSLSLLFSFFLLLFSFSYAVSRTPLPKTLVLSFFFPDFFLAVRSSPPLRLLCFLAFYMVPFNPKKPSNLRPNLQPRACTSSLCASCV